MAANLPQVKTAILIDNQPFTKEALARTKTDILLAFASVAEAAKGLAPYFKAIEKTRPADAALIGYKLLSDSGQDGLDLTLDISNLGMRIICLSAIIEHQPPWADEILNRDMIPNRLGIR